MAIETDSDAMNEIFQTLLLLLGLLEAHVADPGDRCANGVCPAVPDRPVVAWSAPQTLRADEVRLFSRGESRPGQAGCSIVLRRVGEPAADGERAFLIVAPAPERLRASLADRATVQLRLRRIPAPR